jgi:hypothetical protein
MNRLAILVLAAAAAGSAASSAPAAVTGTLTPAYGSPLAVQTTQTIADAASGNTLASPSPPSWNQLQEWLTTLATLRESLGVA